MRKLLRESKATLELAVIKCLAETNLTPSELTEVCAISESELMSDHGCDLFMAKNVKLHCKKELFRLRAQNQFTKMDDLQDGDGYPSKPFTRTEYIKESKNLNEDYEEDQYDWNDGWNDDLNMKKNISQHQADLTIDDVDIDNVDDSYYDYDYSGDGFDGADVEVSLEKDEYE